MTFILFFTGLFTKSGLAALTTKYTKTQQTVFTMKLFGVLHISSGQALSIQVRNYYCYLYIFFNKGAKKLALNLVFWVLRWSFYAVSRRTLFFVKLSFLSCFPGSINDTRCDLGELARTLQFINCSNTTFSSSNICYLWNR